MRLLNAKTLNFEEFMNEKSFPKYAILSHTWGSEEVTYQDMRDGLSQAVQQKTGFTKIRWACQQAKAEGLEFCWVDTCCIDKTSSAELSEAINSMFRWYSRSAVCYAYLNDVEVVAGAATDLWQSKWFTRGCRSPTSCAELWNKHFVGVSDSNYGGGLTTTAHGIYNQVVVY